MLTKSEIVADAIVQHSQSNGERESTYDATVGVIISEGKDVGSTYTLPPRGVVWVVSKEDFHLQADTTAVAALRTTWAHNGIFALNVGVVDPGWKGPVATALVNFSTEDFSVSHGDPFMRLMFFKHKPTQPSIVAVSRGEYVKKMKKNSRDFSDSFLNMTSLVDEVAGKIFSLPKVVVVAAWVAVLVAVLAIFVPILFSVWMGVNDDKISIARLQQRIEQLEKDRSAQVSDAHADKSETPTNFEQSHRTTKGEKLTTAPGKRGVAVR